MEYQVLTRGTDAYPKRLPERLGKNAPAQLCFHGPLSLLDRFTMAVICADSIDGEGFIETNQLLFTIREYDLNYIGGWHSMMETEIFRLGLFRSNSTVTLFTAKGLRHETFESYLLDRFYPPLHEFPEREEYFRRGSDGELLVLSAVEPDVSRTSRKNVMDRNRIACALGDVVFAPFGPKGSKTYRLAAEIKDAGWPVFTLEHELSRDLHEIGIPGLNRKTVGGYLEGFGASRNPNPPPRQNRRHKVDKPVKPSRRTTGIQEEIPFVSDKPSDSAQT